MLTISYYFDLIRTRPPEPRPIIWTQILLIWALILGSMGKSMCTVIRFSKISNKKQAFGSTYHIKLFLQLPDCFCSPTSTKVPGNLDPATVPQVSDPCVLRIKVIKVKIRIRLSLWIRIWLILNACICTSTIYWAFF